jgi:sugar phosphate isomerase/epimerase
MRISATVCLVPSLSRGPWIYWHDLAAAAAHAGELGLDGLELFTTGPEAPPAAEVRALLDDHGLACAAVGTGAGKVLHGLTFTDPDADVRERAVDFARDMIDYGAALDCHAIIGSMQGFTGGDRPAAEGRLADALRTLGAHAAERDQVLIYEPLNRYESDLFNRQADAAAFVRSQGLAGVKLLADLFHMNIEEADLGAALRASGELVGHVHLADSNRGPAGTGHTDLGAVGKALREIEYSGWLSAEAFPDPTPEDAAAETLRAGRSIAG